jgi:hypothetical protein
MKAEKREARNRVADEIEYLKSVYLFKYRVAGMLMIRADSCPCPVMALEYRKASKRVALHEQAEFA